MDFMTIVKVPFMTGIFPSTQVKGNLPPPTQSKQANTG